MRLVEGEHPVYHGTDRHFTTFDDAHRGDSSSHPTALLGHFVSRDAQHAANYPAFSKDKHVLALMLRHGRYFKLPINQYYDRFPRRSSPETVAAFRAELQAAGYDGIEITRPDAEFPDALLGEVGTLIVFDPRHLRLR